MNVVLSSPECTPFAGQFQSLERRLLIFHDTTVEIFPVKFHKSNKRPVMAAIAYSVVVPF
jgi:hypothetical protein